MRHLLRAYFDGQLSCRAFFHQLVVAGLTAISLVPAAESGESPASSSHSLALLVEPQKWSERPLAVVVPAPSGGDVTHEELSAHLQLRNRS